MNDYLHCLLQSSDVHDLAHCSVAAAAAQLRSDFADIVLTAKESKFTLAAARGWPESWTDALLASRQAMVSESRDGLATQCQLYDGRETLVPWPLSPPTNQAQFVHLASWPALNAPIWSERSLRGSLTVQRPDRPFEPNEEQALYHISAQLTLALSKLRDLELAQQHINETNLMYRLSSLAAQRLTGPAMLEEIARILAEFFRLRHAALALLDEDGRHMTVVSNYSTMQDDFNPIGQKIPVVPGTATATVLDTAQPLQIVNVPDSPLMVNVRDLMKKRGTETMIIFPLLMWGEVIGTFGLDIGEKGRVFSPSEQHLLQAVTGQISSLVENVRLTESLEQRAREAEQMASHDSLTGLPNRRLFFETAVLEFARAKRYGRNLSLIMLDLNHFKKINDNYGHLVGDQLLQEAANRMMTATRVTDMVARYAGDEFIILLPETDRPGAMAIVERLHQVVSGDPVETELGSVTLNMSMGVAVLAEHSDLTALLDEADKKMYQHKQATKGAAR